MSVHSSPLFDLKVMRDDHTSEYQSVWCPGRPNGKWYIAANPGEKFHFHVTNNSRGGIYSVTPKVDGKDIGSSWRVKGGDMVCCNAATWEGDMVQEYDLVFATPATGPAAMESNDKIGVIELWARQLIGSKTSQKRKQPSPTEDDITVPDRTLPPPFQVAKKTPLADGKKFWEGPSLAVSVGQPQGPARRKQTTHNAQEDVYGGAFLTVELYYCTPDSLQLRLNTAAPVEDEDKQGPPPPPSLEAAPSALSLPITMLPQRKRVKLEQPPIIVESSVTDSVVR